MKNKKYRNYDLQIKEKALALYAINNNGEQTAKEFNIPPATVRSWVQQANKNKDFIAFRDERKKEFIQTAWDNIKMGNDLLKKRLNRALNQEEELMQLIDIMQDEKLTTEDKQKIMTKIKEMRLDNINQISTVIGTLYDKQALASGDVTSREEQVIKKFEDF